MEELWANHKNSLIIGGGVLLGLSIYRFFNVNKVIISQRDADDVLYKAMRNAKTIKPKLVGGKKSKRKRKKRKKTKKNKLLI